MDLVMSKPVSQGCRAEQPWNACAEVVTAIANLLLRDPRVHPRIGDIVDDDPPLAPLTVVAVWPSEFEPRVVEAERRTLYYGHVVVTGRWKGTIAQWTEEMRE